MESLEEMKFYTNYGKTAMPFKIFFFCLGFLCFANSCNPFEEEFKQDKRLGFYRYQMYNIPDSIPTGMERISAYKSIVEEANLDVFLITERKKNMLLSEVYNTISEEYYKLNDMDEAIASSTKAILLNQANQHAYYNRGCIYQAICKDSLAIIDYTKAITYDDQYTDSYYNRGIIYEKNTDFQLAIEDYSKAINLSPSYVADIYNNRGNVHQEMKFFKKAIADYDKALKIDPTLAITYCNRADVYMKLEAPEKAIMDYKKAFEADSCNTVILDKITHIIKNNKWGKAIRSKGA